MKKIELVFIFFLFWFPSQAQNYGVGVFGGISTYIGDLSASKYPNNNTSTGVIGISAFKAITNHLLVRGELNYTVVAGDDKYNKDSAKIKRNLNFESSILEFNIIGELYLLNRSAKKFSPYIIGGVGIFHFNPFTQIDGNNVYLKPLSTEGEGLSKYPDRKEYNLTQPTLTYGAGLKYSITEQIDVKCEISFRKLFTDYLDDVSKSYIDKTDLLIAKGQLAVGAAYRGDEVRYGNPIYPTKGTARGNSTGTDSYYYIGIGITYAIASNAFFAGSPSSMRQVKCPPAL